MKRLFIATLSLVMLCGHAVAGDPFTQLGDFKGVPKVSVLPSGGDASLKMVMYNLDGRIVVFFETTALFSRPSWQTQRVHRGMLLTYITAVADGETLGGGFNGFGLEIDPNQPHRAKVIMDGSALMLARASSVGVVMPSDGKAALFKITREARSHLGLR